MNPGSHQSRREGRRGKRDRKGRTNKRGEWRRNRFDFPVGSCVKAQWTAEFFDICIQ
jgi:hypothetical protein